MFLACLQTNTMFHTSWTCLRRLQNAITTAKQETLLLSCDAIKFQMPRTWSSRCTASNCLAQKIRSRFLLDPQSRTFWSNHSPKQKQKSSNIKTPKICNNKNLCPNNKCNNNNRCNSNNKPRKNSFNINQHLSLFRHRLHYNQSLTMPNNKSNSYMVVLSNIINRRFVFFCQNCL